MILRNLFIILLFVLMSSEAMSASTSGEIKVLRATTSDVVVSQQRMLFIKLSNAFHSACSWVTIGTDNSYFTSILLSAEARSKSVKIWYDETNPAPGYLCTGNTIEIINTTE